ncbi:MAG: hypothetical protein IJ229_01995 [Clostridia bacterium]|nr:hypothetical protein [Clostridia bacterium]
MDRRDLMIDDAPFGIPFWDYIEFLTTLTDEQRQEVKHIYTDEEFAEFRKRIGK